MNNASAGPGSMIRAEIQVAELNNQGWVADVHMRALQGGHGHLFVQHEGASGGLEAGLEAAQEALTELARQLTA